MKTTSTLLPFLFLLSSTTSLAQSDWPAKSVRVIVPSATGGGADFFTRLLAQGLSDALKQPFVVDNRPGGNSNIGAEAVARSARDGYTMMVSGTPALVVNNLLYKNLSYDAERDFAAVSSGVIGPLIFVVHPGVPARSLAELATLGKKDPGKFAYGTAQGASATSLGVQMLESLSGAKFTQVPYKGTGQSMQDLLGGQIAFMLSDVPTVLSNVKSGKMVAIAATLRTKVLPEVPTAADAGYAALGDIGSTFMVVVPSGVPVPIIQRLNSEINRLMKTPAVIEKLDAFHFIPLLESPEEFAARLKKLRAMWADAIVKFGIKAE